MKLKLTYSIEKTKKSMQLQLHLSSACDVGHHLHSLMENRSCMRTYVHGHRGRHVCGCGSGADPTALLARLCPLLVHGYGTLVTTSFIAFFIY